MRVAEVMTEGVQTVPPTLVRGRTIGCIPVTDGKRLVGIVTVSDLLELLGRGIDRPAKARHRRTSYHRVPPRKMGRPTGVR